MAFECTPASNVASSLKPMAISSPIWSLPARNRFTDAVCAALSEWLVCICSSHIFAHIRYATYATLVSKARRHCENTCSTISRIAHMLVLCARCPTKTTSHSKCICSGNMALKASLARHAKRRLGCALTIFAQGHRPHWQR